jgi:copper(I)-binding protein
VSGQLAQLHGMQVKTFVNPAPARTIGAVWRKSSTRGTAIDAIVASIRGAMQSRTGSRRDMKAATRLVAVVLAVVGGTAQAADAVVATAAWARATPPGLATGAGYVTLAGGIHADRLVAAQLDGVARIEFHESSLDGGVARMRQLPSVAIPARTTVAFSPAGLHLMLIGLARPLVAG